jgi:uncharacterized protein YceH (UPF0502 family)
VVRNGREAFSTEANGLPPFVASPPETPENAWAVRQFEQLQRVVNAHAASLTPGLEARVAALEVRVAALEAIVEEDAWDRT